MLIPSDQSLVKSPDDYIAVLPVVPARPLSLSLSHSVALSLSLPLPTLLSQSSAND